MKERECVYVCAHLVVGILDRTILLNDSKLNSAPYKEEMNVIKINIGEIVS